MSRSWVIQDSDDEDDPLAADFPLPASQTYQVDDSYSINSIAEDVPITAQVQEPNHPISINFDVFLQSQETAPGGLSSSQQQREQRWIPNEAGGGSIGSMMTQIGRAQQRLFDDDDAQYTNRRLPPHTTAIGSEPIQPSLPHMDDVHLVPAVDVNNPQHTDYDNIGNGPEYVHQTSDTVTHQYEPIAHREHHPQSFLSNGSPPPVASYNLFESSLQTPRSSTPDPMCFLKPDDALQIDLQNGARRWNSMQGILSSPHDTEPNSSLLSAKANRSQSDNACSNGASAPRLEIQHPAESPDRLPHTIAIQTLAEPKKRGRPKKQTPLETVETVDLPRSANQDISEPNNTKPEKRKPGRPPKNPKPDAERIDVPNTDDQSAEPLPTSIVPEQQILLNEPDLPGLPADIPQNSTAATTNFYIEIPNQQSPAHQAPTEALQTLEPKKKKLKRGKTTSVTLQKTYDPDVEDDVIWIDDALPNPIIYQQEQHSLNSEVSHPTDPPNNIQPEPAPQPKKRGRKRKKTSDLVVEEKPRDEIDKKLSDIHTEQDQPTVSVTVDDTTKTMVAKNAIHNLDTHDVSRDLEADSENTHSESTPELTTNENPPETPKKSVRELIAPSMEIGTSGKGANKGPGKHSPISTGKVPYRVGLSRRARIAPLLKIVRR
ncbi:hypothetical protein BDV26DRAFT_293599 [Aspergillus bertholletiae]|uniref:Uncharacterized protein n=1 Tax=Aspergillus bertholletiae TaxID=1226010 RepID=A0A5N7B4K9_9EURO|nr:hypothetical protein BDV26DRAFT_293599 [Aspergillus bertholletiae]